MKQSWKYHKIMSIFKRERETNKIIEGQYSTPEIEYLKDKKWIFTEKVDGTNIRIKYDGNDAIYCGRGEYAQIPATLIQKLNEHFVYHDARERLSRTFIPTAGEDMEVLLYGEGFGARIMKGGGNYNPDGVDFVLFDVCINGWWIDRVNVAKFAKQLGIQSVPVIGLGTLDDAITAVKNGLKSQWGDFIAEGIVARPEVELFTRKGDRIITKIKHKDFQ